MFAVNLITLSALIAEGIISSEIFNAAINVNSRHFRFSLLHNAACVVLINFNTTQLIQKETSSVGELKFFISRADANQLDN